MLEGHLQAPFVGAAPVALRYTALAGFGPDQAPPRQPPLDGGALERQVALRYSTLAGIEPGQASPQPAPLDGAGLQALTREGHQPTQDWAALVTPVPLGYLASGWWQNSGETSHLAQN